MACSDQRIKKPLGIAMALILPMVPCHALAERGVVTGEIGSIGAKDRTLSLRTGEVFRAGPKVKLSSRRIGEKVIVVYEQQAEGELRAIKVRRVPQELEAFVPRSARDQNADPGHGITTRKINAQGARE